MAKSARRWSGTDRPAAAYGLALVAVAAATVIRFAVDPLLGDTAQFVTFFVAIVFAGAIGGRGPALAATALSCLTVASLFVKPRLSAGATGMADAVAMAMFVTAAVCIAWLAGRMHAARREMTRELAERLAAQDALAHERERLAVTLSSIGDAVIATDEKGLVRFLNRMASALTGWTSDEAMGQPLGSVAPFVNEKTRSTGDDVVARVLQEGRAVAFGNDTLLIARSGRELPVEDSAAPIIDADGRVVGVVLVFHDVSAQRAARAVLRESEERLRLAQQVASIGTFEWDIRKGVNRWTPELEAMYGLPPGRFPGTQPDWERLVHPEDRTEAVRQVALAMKTGVFECEWRVVWPDGTVHWLQGRGRVFRDDAGRPVKFLGVNIDITARKAAEAAILRLGRRLESIVESAGDGICGLDGNLGIVLVNPALAQMLGWDPADMLGKNSHQLFHHSLPDGGPFPVADCPIHRALREGRSLRNSDVFWRKDGTSLPVEYRYTPSRGGGDVMSVLMVTDTTERTRAESALVEAKQSAERAKAIAEEATRAKDHFLAVLSHELRTPLTPVVAILDLLEGGPWDEETKRHLDIVRRNVDLEARLIDDLLDLTRITRGKVELHRGRMDLATILDRAVEVCRPDIDARRVHFGVDLGPAPYVVEADAARLQQVFWNLLKNAVKFTPYDGCIGIRCRPEGGYVVVEVNDSGVGIDPEVLAHIFDAFRQAERSITRQFGGLGLGLTISKALVEMHGGSISAHSEGRGRGATIRVMLPLAEVAEEHASAEPKVDEPSARGVRVLLVEDHGDTAVVMQVALAAHGFEVQTAGDVATALTRATSEPFDVLISDLGLPDASGHDLLRELRARGQMLPAIALSGYGQEEDLRLSREAGFAMHLVKPLRPTVLTEAVVRVVGQAAAGHGGDGPDAGAREAPGRREGGPRAASP